MWYMIFQGNIPAPIMGALGENLAKIAIGVFIQQKMATARSVSIVAAWI